MPTLEKLKRETPGNPQFQGYSKDPCPTVCASLFTWKDNHGTTEASDLRWNIYPASFYIKSPKTGLSLLFLRSEAITTGSGDDEELGGFKYLSPGQGFTCTVFND